MFSELISAQHDMFKHLMIYLFSLSAHFNCTSQNKLCTLTKFSFIEMPREDTCLGSFPVGYQSPLNIVCNFSFK